MTLNVISSAFRFFSASSVATGSIRGELTVGRNVFFDLLLTCTAIVALGVLLEEAESWLPAEKSTMDIMRGLVPNSPRKWSKTLMRIGWLLILLGVIGEGIFEAAVSWSDTALQDFNNTLLAITTEQAGNAAQSATTARKEADAAEKEAGEAGTWSEKAQREALNAFTLAKSDQAMVAWRTVSAKQEDNLKIFLFPSKGRSLTVSWEAKDPEENAFGPQLVSALRSAGLNVTVLNPGLIMYPQGDTTLGIVVKGRLEDPLTLELGEALVCSELTNMPDISRVIGTGPNTPVDLEIRAKDPIKRPIPDNCKSFLRKP
jgi:hypothetical protein